MENLPPAVLNWDPSTGDTLEWRQNDLEFCQSVTKIVLGSLEEEAEVAVDFPKSFADTYPNLTHLYIWKIKNITAVPTVPEMIQVLDIRGCSKLQSLANLPGQSMRSLILEDLPLLEDIDPILSAEDAVGIWSKAYDVSLSGCAKLSQKSVSKVLKYLSNDGQCDQDELRLDFIALPELKSIDVRLLPGRLADLRVNDCRNLHDWVDSGPSHSLSEHGISSRVSFPPRLRRLELKRSSVTWLPDFPMKLDYLDLEGADHIRFLPAMSGREGFRAETAREEPDGSITRLPRSVFLTDSAIAMPAWLREKRVLGLNYAQLDHFWDVVLGYGEYEEARDVRVVLIGSGRAGKSDLARVLKERVWGEGTMTTQGVKFWPRVELPSRELQDERDSVKRIDSGAGAKYRFHIWDFAGQDFYHDTHQAFFESDVIFVICDNTGGLRGYHKGSDQIENAEIDPTWDKDRTIDYWYDQVRAIGFDRGREPEVIIIRTKCDRDQDAREAAKLLGEEIDPQASFDKSIDALKRQEGRKDLPPSTWVVNKFSAKWAAGVEADLAPEGFKDGGLAQVVSALNRAADRVLGSEVERKIYPELRIIRERVLAHLDESKPVNSRSAWWKDRGQFLAECESWVQEALDPEREPQGEVRVFDLDRVPQDLHKLGVVYYSKERAAEAIVLDQARMLEGVYLPFDRTKGWLRLQEERGNRQPGICSLHELRKWGWDEGGYGQEDQRVLLAFMIECGFMSIFYMSRRAQSEPESDIDFSNSIEYIIPSATQEEGEKENAEGLDDQGIKVSSRYLGRRVVHQLALELVDGARAGVKIWRWGASIQLEDPMPSLSFEGVRTNEESVGMADSGQTEEVVIRWSPRGIDADQVGKDRATGPDSEPQESFGGTIVFQQSGSEAAIDLVRKLVARLAWIAPRLEEIDWKGIDEPKPQDESLKQSIHPGVGAIGSRVAVVFAGGDLDREAGDDNVSIERWPTKLIEALQDCCLPTVSYRDNDLRTDAEIDANRDRFTQGIVNEDWLVLFASRKYLLGSAECLAELYHLQERAISGNTTDHFGWTLAFPHVYWAGRENTTDCTMLFDDEMAGASLSIDQFSARLPSVAKVLFEGLPSDQHYLKAPLERIRDDASVREGVVAVLTNAISADGRPANCITTVKVDPVAETKSVCEMADRIRRRVRSSPQVLREKAIAGINRRTPFFARINYLAYCLQVLETASGSGITVTSNDLLDVLRLKAQEFCSFTDPANDCEEGVAVRNLINDLMATFSKSDGRPDQSLADQIEIVTKTLRAQGIANGREFWLEYLLRTANKWAKQTGTRKFRASTRLYIHYAMTKSGNQFFPGAMDSIPRSSFPELEAEVRSMLETVLNDKGEDFVSGYELLRRLPLHPELRATSGPIDCGGD